MTKDCSECTETSPCNNYHVYVIELKKKVLDKEPSFPFEGELPRGKRVYYVGQTSHSVKCRYKQHVAPRKKKSRKGFLCNCFTDEPELKPFRPQNAPGKFVNEYHKRGGLRPKLYHDKNPAVRKPEENYRGMMKEISEKIEQAEEDLALELRSRGHAVHYN